MVDAGIRKLPPAPEESSTHSTNSTEQLASTDTLSSFSSPPSFPPSPKAHRSVAGAALLQAGLLRPRAGSVARPPLSPDATVPTIVSTFRDAFRAAGSALLEELRNSGIELSGRWEERLNELAVDEHSDTLLVSLQGNQKPLACLRAGAPNDEGFSEITFMAIPGQANALVSMLEKAAEESETKAAPTGFDVMFPSTREHQLLHDLGFAAMDQEGGHFRLKLSNSDVWKREGEHWQFQPKNELTGPSDSAFATSPLSAEFGVVQNAPILGHTGERERTARE
jgi:hypothetical protein